MRKRNEPRLTICIRKSIREQFNQCCQANDETMTKVLIDFIKGYVKVNKHKVLGGEES